MSAYCRHPDCVTDVSKEGREGSYVLSQVEPLPMFFDTDEELLLHAEYVHGLKFKTHRDTWPSFVATDSDSGGSGENG